MVLTNEELKEIYFGAYEFEETKDGYLQAFQYSKKQIEYFKDAFEMWYERCTASTAKTLEFKTSANKLSFDYKITGTSNNTFQYIVQEGGPGWHIYGGGPTTVTVDFTTPEEAEPTDEESIDTTTDDTSLVEIEKTEANKK